MIQQKSKPEKDHVKVGKEASGIPPNFISLEKTKISALRPILFKPQKAFSSTNYYPRRQITTLFGKGNFDALNWDRWLAAVEIKSTHWQIILYYIRPVLLQGISLCISQSFARVIFLNVSRSSVNFSS
mgnify:FL=1